MPTNCSIKPNKQAETWSAFHDPAYGNGVHGGVSPQWIFSSHPVPRPPFISIRNWRSSLLLSPARIIILSVCLFLLAPLPAFSFQGYHIKNKALNLLDPQTEWETHGEHSLVQAWKNLQEVIGPLQLELLSVAYGQLWSDAEVNGVSHDGRALLGWDTRFKAHWRPWRDGQIFLQLQYNFGDKGKTPSGEGLLLSHVNGVATDAQPEGKYTFHDLLFTQHFFDRRFFFAFGHTDPEVFMDDNRFANSDHTQFSSQIFSQEIGLDNVDERAPLFALGFEPHSLVEIVGVISSTTKSHSDAPKSLWTRPFWDGPFIGGQIHFKPAFKNRTGNYRLFAWSTLYDQPQNDGRGEACNWGLALNFDQDVTDRLGVFGRLGYANQDVSITSWDWSAGLQYTGLLPTRGKDILALAIGGVQASPGVEYGGMEIHMESYYKLQLTDWFALTPMLMYTVQPTGSPDSIPIIQGMLRLELDLKTAS